MAAEAELIKSKLLLSDIVGKRVSLQNRGTAGYVGLCPFHKENTPSFFVNNEKAMYHCFGCSAHGDAFTFLMEYEGVGYKEALEKLAHISGVKLKKDTPKIIAQVEKTKVFFQIYKKAAEFYQQQLHLDHGKKALNYILSRGISLETISRFQLGFAPKDSSHLVNLLKANFTDDDLFESGIIQKKNNFTYDPFYNRLIFPIQDKSEKVIAFGGRIIDEGQPKYLNSAENPIFHKSSHLYGYNFAKTHIYRQKEALVVEGYMDVISLANQGIHNVVAPLGANIKLSQIEMLWGTCIEPTICFDDDEAGQNAAIKIAHEILKCASHNKSLKFTKLKYGKDPDEIIKNKGVKFFEQLVEDSTPLADYIFNYEVDKLKLNTPEKKILLKKNIESIVESIADPDVKKSYSQHLINKYYNLLVSLKTKRGKDYVASSKSDILKLKKSAYTQNKEQEELSIISILCEHPALLNDNEIIEELIAIELPNSLDKIRKILLDSTLDLGTETSFLYDKVVSNSAIDSGIIRTLETLRSFNGHNSLESAKISLFRAFDIKKMKIIKKELEQIKAQLLVTIDDKLMKKMLYLKECQQQLEIKLKNY
jgi:DNA primase